MNYFRVHQAIVVLTHGHVLFGNPHFVASVFFFENDENPMDLYREIRLSDKPISGVVS